MKYYESSYQGKLFESVFTNTRLDAGAWIRVTYVMQTTCKPTDMTVLQMHFVIST